MKRTQEKIKDFVEPQFFDEVQNVNADPARALAAYRFTDVTADLLGRWLDTLADLPRGRGAARALAGARGVGKSHTLAVFSALAESENLRALVEDAHVATSTRRLAERRYTVVRVERGLRETLAEEMAAAFTLVFGGNEVQWGNDPAQMLAVAASRANDRTLVVVIDTAFNRPSRVRRDDGPQLGALTVVTQGVNAFVALALDDDIADADGANVALAGTYQIDYLDAEHLYRVVEQYLLLKSPQARSALHDIYQSLRASVPGFNWSEPRFASLYPVHPLVADVAAAVRLYAHAFAFLPFAAMAAARATSRPALSLILLDEVFDSVEAELRKSDDLREAFAAYDHLATKGMEQFPVMQRLHAKLVLKSLFILSLDGRGATSSELCAALLMSDETSHAKATGPVDDMLTRLAKAALPDSLYRSEAGAGAEVRYRFQIGASAAFDAALERGVGASAESKPLALNLLGGVARARFPDWPFADEPGEAGGASSFYVAWRGTERPGRLAWQAAGSGAAPRGQGTATQQDDWEVLLLAPGETAGAEVAEDAGVKSPGEAAVRAVWHPAELTAEEVLTLRRLHVLRTDAQLSAKFGQTARVATSVLAAQAERIWSRVYMNEGTFVVDGAAAEFNDRVFAARTLRDALAEILAPHFDGRYPEHPRFTGTLGEVEAERLLETLFGGEGGGSAAPDTVRLCKDFALPLGVATLRGDVCTFDLDGEALTFPWNREVLALTDGAAGASVPLERVREVLRRAPHGLLRESQRLVLSSLVAQRRIELSTTSGERISRRTPVRDIKWESVAGVCRADAVEHDPGHLTELARLLTGRPALASVATPAGRDEVRTALAEWLRGWLKQRVCDAFEALPDGSLTTRLWKTNASLRKSFGAAADAIDSTLAGRITLEECLERVGESFVNSTDNLKRAVRRLEDFGEYVTSYERHERERAYISAAEPTGVGEIETARREMLKITEDPHGLLSGEGRERFRMLWREFHTRYVEHYAGIHDKTVGVARDREPLEVLRRSEHWREFEAISALPVVSRHLWGSAEELLSRDASGRCDLPARLLLEAQPRCACAFRLSSAAEFERLPDELGEIMQRGLRVYRHTLEMLSGHLAIALDALARKEADEEAARRARALATAFAQGTAPEHFSRVDVRLVERALQRMAAPPPVRVPVPVGDYGLLTREDLRARLGQWVDELPEQPVLIEVVAGKQTNAP